MAGKPNILIATPIFLPSIGGPAVYAENLARHLVKRGWDVAVLSYGRQTSWLRECPFRVHFASLRLPLGLRHMIYFLKAMKLAARSKAVLIFDPFAVGVPAAAACRFLTKPILVRVEGDYLWETYVGRTRDDITLLSFYQKLPSLRLSLKEKVIYRFLRLVFSWADCLVFSSRWREEIFNLGYAAAPGTRTLIDPPWPAVEGGREVREKILLFAGRFVKVKNLIRLIYAFLDAAERGWRLELVGSGPDEKKIRRTIGEAGVAARVIVSPPLSHAEMVVKISSAYALLLPSLSDVSPNVILECIRTATPFLLTKETSFYDALKDVGLFVDPLDDKDIREKLRRLFNPEDYAAFRSRLISFRRLNSWDDIAGRWSGLVTKMLK